MAAYGEPEVERLLADAGIVRHRGKIEATIGNAAAALEARGRALRAGLELRAPRRGRLVWRRVREIPDSTAESLALSKELKRRGFRFVGPTTVYAFMQSAGLVDDHIAGCWSPAAAGRPV